MLEFNGRHSAVSKTAVLLADLRQVSVSWWGIHDNGVLPPRVIGTLSDEGGWGVRAENSKTQFVVGRNTIFDKHEADTTFSTTEVVHHIVTWDGGLADGAVQAWHDGVKDTVTYTGGSGVHETGNGEDLDLGWQTVSGVNTIGWIGIWGRVLDEAEVIQLFHRRSPLHFLNELVAYWRLDNELTQKDLIGNVDLRWDGNDSSGVWRFTNIDIVDPPAFKWQGQQHNPVDLAPDADTMFTKFRGLKGIKR